MAGEAIGLTKTCSKCGETKPRTPEFFHYCNGYPRPRCRPCWNEWETEYFWANREKKRESAKKKWAKTDKRAARRKVNEWKAANPEKAKDIELRRLERIKSCPELRAKEAAKVRRWRAANADNVRAKKRKRYSENPERHRSYTREWRERNRETVRARDRAYKAAHPEKSIADAEARRVRMLGAEGSFTGHDVIALIKAHGRVCFYCRVKLKRYQVDHFIPLSKGGTNWPSNLVISCGPCNQRKAAKLPWEWQPNRFKEGQPPRA